MDHDAVQHGQSARSRGIGSNIFMGTVAGDVLLANGAELAVRGSGFRQQRSKRQAEAAATGVVVVVACLCFG